MSPREQHSLSAALIVVGLGAASCLSGSNTPDYKANHTCNPVNTDERRGSNRAFDPKSWSQDNGILEDSIKIDSKAYVIVSNSSSRFPIEELRMKGASDDSCIRIGDDLWAIPEHLFAGPGSRVQLECLGLHSIAHSPLERIGRVTYAQLDEQAMAVAAQCKLVEFTTQIIALNQQLQTALMGRYPYSSRRFLAFDFLTHSKFQSMRPSMKELEAIRADFRPPGNMPVDPELWCIIDFFMRRKELPADEIIKGAILMEKMIYNTVSLPLLNKSIDEQLLDFFRIHGLYIIDALQLLGPDMNSTGYGRPLSEDIILFSDGSLMLNERESREFMNCEPNGALFFSFFDVFLRCAEAGLGPAPKGSPPHEWHEWSVAALLGTALFIDCYKPEGSPDGILERYTWKCFPRRAPDYPTYKAVATQAINSLRLNWKLLESEHHRLIKCAAKSIEHRCYSTN
ncbi:MAG: hypothetical protein ACI835_000886 [Planctomycetota bacterium]